MFDFAANTSYTRAVWIEFCFCLACRVKKVASQSAHAYFSQAQFLVELPKSNIAAVIDSPADCVLHGLFFIESRT